MKHLTKSKWYRQFYLIVLGMLILLALIFFAYTSNYYRATSSAHFAMMSTHNVEVTENNQEISFIPTNTAPSTGIIFYPGAKVEASSYAPLMHQLAEKGYLCVIAKMPFHLAFFNSRAADAIMMQYPTISSWYLSGHSLGGAMAASYLKEHTDAFDGLILLASYSTADLKDSNLKVLSIYGSNDGVLNKTHYIENRPHLPSDLKEILIEGGNHAYFGFYGDQKGDGTASLPPTSQISLTAEAISHFIQG